MLNGDEVIQKDNERNINFIGVLSSTEVKILIRVLYYLKKRTYSISPFNI